MNRYTGCMKVIDPFMQPKGRGAGKRTGALSARQFTVQALVQDSGINRGYCGIGVAVSP